MLSHKCLKETLLHFNFFHKFCVCVTSRLIDVVSVFQIKLSKENLCVFLSFLPFGKMLSKKKHAADNFLLKFQNEAIR